MRTARAVLNLTLLVLWTALLLPAQAAAAILKLRWAKRIPMLYHRGVARIIGMRIDVRGEIAGGGPTLFVVNHASWLDITVLDTLVKGCFVAKREVASWPLFGLLAKLQRTVFVERAPSRTLEQRNSMVLRLEAGQSLMLFPEGTSGDGNRVLPFRSALFAAAEEPIAGKPVTVQPVTIAYVGLNGVPMGRRNRPLFAWYGDMALVPHVWGVLGAGPSTVAVRFHKPVTIASFASRKGLAAHCQGVIAAGLSNALSGRIPVPREATAQDVLP